LKKRPSQRLALATVVGALLAGGGITGCEAVLGTSDLRDSDAATDATTFDADHGDEGDDDLFEASNGEAGPRGEAGSSEAGPGDGGMSEASLPPSPSCANSASRYTCGVQQNDDCCAVDPVTPAGTYERTYPSGSVGNPGTNPATLTGFALDRYEVTVGRFRQYVSYLQSGKGAPPAEGSGVHTYLNADAGGGPGLLIDPTLPFYETGWASQDNGNVPVGADAGATWTTGSCNSTYTATPEGGENIPITCVTWYEAYAFCIWDGGYLPSEAEWEYAAADGSQEREYPWGSTNPGTTNAYAQFACAGDCPAVVGTASLGADAFGHFDMMGNVAEWVLDDYVAYDDPSEDMTGCHDCLNYDVSKEGSNGESKVSRGGAYLYALSDPALYPPGRSEFVPTTRLGYLGMRCGRNPAP
jgi:sulfatase modifying factor 1